ncbi:hypothetical protein HMPREF0322_03944 [Desulfitobacterium hafniense DP7]|uniref:Uncharacterized protein n=1 Tax=Desulfitobacterium hafniense DP7 TaxID=537010 RepID=G9XSH2_DESHA|nr:hypothetical protein HMPREF0322_03944 [Desulfitobacterium hafniense DP7]
MYPYGYRFVNKNAFAGETPQSMESLLDIFVWQCYSFYGKYAFHRKGRGRQ